MAIKKKAKLAKKKEERAKVEPIPEEIPVPVEKPINRLSLRYGTQEDCEKAGICASKGCTADAVIGNICKLCAKQLGKL